MKYILSHDFGTSSNKAVLIATNGEILASAIAHYPLQTPRPGWVEQKPEDYWQAVVECTRELLKKVEIEASDILGMAFSTQAMGIIPLSKEGEVLHPNITWVDGRAEEQSEAFMKRFLHKSIFKAIVGIHLTGKDVIPKILWLKQQHPDLYEKTHKILDVNGFLKYKCTGKMVAEWSGACSYAFDVKKKDWERLFFKIAGIDLEKLPDLVRSIDCVGGLSPEAAGELGLPEGLKIYGGCDDTQSAAAGSGAIGEGEGHIYLGTSAWVGVVTEKNLKFKNGAVCLQSANPSQNLVVGITESAGANIDWFINNFYKKEKEELGDKIFELIEKESAEVPPGADHLIFSPWFLGERCPVSTTTTRSTVFNLSHEHTRGHFARAHFEGIAFNLRWIIENMEKDFGFDLRKLRIIGGGVANDLWMQTIADITQREIIRTSQPKMAGALGVANCVLAGSGEMQGFDSIHDFVKTTEHFLPNPENKAIYTALFASYQQLYRSLEKTYKNANYERFSE